MVVGALGSNNKLLGFSSSFTSSRQRGGNVVFGGGEDSNNAKIAVGIGNSFSKTTHYTVVRSSFAGKAHIFFLLFLHIYSPPVPVWGSTISKGLLLYWSVFFLSHEVVGGFVDFMYFWR